MSTCPRCATDLQRGEHGTCVADGCRACGGVWLDAATAQQLLAPLGKRAVQEQGAGTQLSCPVCRAPMVVALAAGVELDVCSAHGVWFDRDELVKVSECVSTLRGAAPPGRHAAYAVWGAAVVPGAVGVAAGLALAGTPEQEQRAAEAETTGIELAADGVEIVGDVAVSGGGEAVVEGVGSVLGGAGEAALEASGTALEGVFAVLGGILEGL